MGEENALDANFPKDEEMIEVKCFDMDFPVLSKMNVIISCLHYDCNRVRITCSPLDFYQDCPLHLKAIIHKF